MIFSYLWATMSLEECIEQPSDFFFNLEECLDFFIVFNGIFCFHIYDEKYFDLPFRCKKANSTICLPNPCIPGLIHNPVSIQCRLSESCRKIEIIWKKTFVRACT